MSNSVLLVDRRKQNGRKIAAQEALSASKISKRKVYCKILVENSTYMRFKIRVNGVEVVKKYKKFSARSVYRHMKKPIKEAEYDERKNISEIPVVLTSGDEKNLKYTTKAQKRN